MAVLEKIRVKMGVFITIVIAVALLSFIIDPDTLQSSLSMFSSKYDVGEMNGESITYQDFQKKVDYYTQIYQMTSGTTSSDDRTQDMINNTAWQDEIAENVLIPAVERAGIRVGGEELLDLSQGKNISPVIANEASFRNEQGEFDRDKLVQFVQAIPQDESGNLQLYWNYLEDNMYKDQMYTKYLTLLAKSDIVNPVDLKQAIADNNTTYDVDFVIRPFGFAIDSTITVSNQEIKDYYEKYKEGFKQQQSRDLEYVVFEVVPSAKDIELAQNDIEKVFGEFESTSSMKSFLARNSDQPYNPYFYKEEELGGLAPEIKDFAKDAKTGDVLPIFRQDNSFMAARVMDIKSLPDSVFVKHILLQGDDEKKADSLMQAIRKGADFTQVALENSAVKNVSGTDATPGDLGWMTQNYLIPGFEEVFTAKTGDLLQIRTNYGLHIVKVGETTQPLKKIQLAVLVKEAVAGKQTYSDYYAKANELVSKSEGELDKFNAAVKELNLNAYPAIRVLPGAKTIANYEKTRDVSKWAFENKKGAVSPIITVDNKYFFVVAVTDIHDEGYATLEEVAPQIRNTLAFEKNGAKLASETEAAVKGASNLEEIAQKLETTVSKQTGIAFSSLTSQSLDPKFVGAIAGAQEGVLTGPVIGEVGVYYFTVTGKEVGAFYTEDDAKQRKNQEFMFMTRVLPNIMAEDADVKDNRYKFY